jgi:hypothetical protein
MEFALDVDEADVGDADPEPDARGTSEGRGSWDRRSVDWRTRIPAMKSVVFLKAMFLLGVRRPTLVRRSARGQAAGRCVSCGAVSGLPAERIRNQRRDESYGFRPVDREMVVLEVSYRLAQQRKGI